MPDLKLPAVLAASHPERVRPLIAPFVEGEPPLPALEATKLQPPVCYWAVYKVSTGSSPSPGSERRLTADLVTLKCFFEETTYREYVAQLEALYQDRLADPRHPRGGLVLVPELNGVLWRFPFDPVMPGLYRCTDGQWVEDVLRAKVPTVAGVQPRLVQYKPEVSAILAYRDRIVRRGRRRIVAYGKCGPEDDVAFQFLVMRRLWQTEASRQGRLRIAEPLAFRRDAGLLLQSRVPGKSIASNRNRAIFLELVRHAGAALAAIHDADVPFGRERTLDGMIAGRRRDLEELQLTAPGLYSTLRQLADEVEQRARRTTPGPTVPSHGDYKWDQFLEERGEFGLIDFELFCQAERWFDVGYFCAYLMPAEPDDWREAEAAVVLRAAFLESYAAAARQSIDLVRVTLFESLTFAVRASVHVEEHQPGWEARAAAFLEVGLDRLVNPAPPTRNSSLDRDRNRDRRFRNL